MRFTARVIRVENPLPSSRIGTAAMIEDYEFLRSTGRPRSAQRAAEGVESGKLKRGRRNPRVSESAVRFRSPILNWRRAKDSHPEAAGCRKPLPSSLPSSFIALPQAPVAADEAAQIEAVNQPRGDVGSL